MLNNLSCRAISLAAALYLLAASAIAAPAAETLTYRDLVERLTDVERIALLPAEGERCAQFSSYNRRSQYDADNDRYVDWHANADGGQVIRKEGELDVLAEMEGPGVIWRIWSATADKGHVKFYLDGASEPAIDLPFGGLFDGTNSPFDHPALSYKSGSGHNSYVPIPYQKSCKIVAEKGWGRYYHFTYATFPKGTKVPTFTRKLSADDAVALKEAGDFLQNRLGEAPRKIEGEQTEEKSVTIAPGQSRKVVELSGPRAITALRVKNMAFEHRLDEIDALRELVLKITWDGAESPAVWSPLGDFFGTAMGVNHYRTLLAGMTEDGFYSHWYMPFGQKAVVEIVNDGPHERKLSMNVSHAPLKRPVEQFGRFHAKWHRDAFNPTRPDRWPDWTVLQTTGRGRFCGMMLHVWNPSGGSNPQYARDGQHWWGEGDEKFFVDGEKFPSTFGTGTEDYFGYAWCDPSLFEAAFHSQSHSQNNKGHQVVNRWQVADNVPFQKSFDGALEKYYPNHWPTLYATVAYWYLDPSGDDPYGPVPVAERNRYYDLTDAHEGETMKVLEVTGGETSVQSLGNFARGQSIWSGGSQLWWQKGQAGDRLRVAVPVAQSGTYAIRIGMTRAPDYATARLHFKGVAPLAPIDFFQKELGPVEIFFGTYDLKRGEHELVVEITGVNNAAKPGSMIGLDYVKLVPVN